MGGDLTSPPGTEKEYWTIVVEMYTLGALEGRLVVLQYTATML